MPRTTSGITGGTGVAVGIVRQSGANTLEVADAAKKLVEEMRPTLPAGMNVAIGSDESLYISRAISKVYQTLAEAAILVVLVIFLFLGSVRAALLTAITIPLSLLFAFICMHFSGIPANLLSLGALDFGIIVDATLIMVEHILHSIHMNEHSKIGRAHV